MLPTGLTADLLPPGEAVLLLPLLPAARTAARLLSGACSCDLYLERDPEHRTEESELRRRYRSAGLSRAGMIRALERHRRGTARARHRPARWAELIAAFVAEHARNAGPTLFYRHVTSHGLAERPPGRGVTEVSVSRVVSAPNEWLPEDSPVVVVREAS